MIQAVIFDFDGLILDTETPELLAWKDLFARHDRELKLELWADLVGRPYTHFDFYSYFQEHVDPAVDIDQLRQVQREKVKALTLQQPVLPGVHDYLREASNLGLRIGLASSSSRTHVTGHLDRLELLHYFEAIRCFEDTTEHKPDPAPYLAVLDELGVSADRAVAFEDSPNGVTAARSAGIFCVAVPNPVTRLLSLAHADLRLESLADEPLDRILLRARAGKRAG
jgi:HAD superfamily hydrolase (TIGR01509 family)